MSTELNESTNNSYVANEQSDSASGSVQQPQPQQQMMATAEFQIEVKDWWIEGGRLGIPKEYRQFFPKPGEPVILIDYEGRIYRSKMHNLWQGVDIGRIDGIKPFYRNHPIVTAGTKLRVKVTGKGTAVVLLGERPARSIPR